MPVKRLVALAAIVASVALVGPAQAFAPSSNPGMHKYEQAAAAFWQAVPNCEQVTYHWPETDPWSHEDGMVAGGRAALGGCEMWLMQDAWGQLKGGGFWGFGAFIENCALVTHEWGHLRGAGHDVITPLEGKIARHCERTAKRRYPRIGRRAF